MPIKITDNLMNRPMEAGTGARGLDISPERVLGNVVQRPTASPNVVKGQAGPTNPAAGMEGEAQARAAQTITKSLTDTASYMENIKIAEEDSRATAAVYELRTKEQNLRKTLGEEAAANNWSNDEYKTRYDESLNTLRDEVFGGLGLSHRKVIDHYEKQWNQQKFEFNAKFDESVIKPRAVAQIMSNAETVSEFLIQDAVQDGSVAGVANAMASATEYFSQPQIVGVLGPDNAQKLAAKVIDRATNAVLQQKLDYFTDLERGPLANTGGDAINDAAALGDVKNQLNFVLDNLPLDADKREELRSKANDMLDKSLKAKQHTFAQETKDRLEAEKKARNYAVDVIDVQLGALAADRKLTPAGLQSHVNSLLKNPAIANDPEALIKVEKVRNKYLDDVRRQRERAETDAAIHAANINPTDQKSVDRAWTTFSKDHLGGKKFGELSAPELEKVGVWLRDERPLKLPKELDSALSYGLLTRDQKEFNRNYTIYQQVKGVAPHLLGDMDKRALDMAERVASGQTFDDAFKAATRQSAMSDDERKAAKTLASKTLEKWKEPADHPLAKAMEVKEMTPSALAAFNREFEDRLLEGMSPQAAQTAAVSAVSRRVGKSSLMSFGGEQTVSMDAPEKKFGVSSEVIKEDLVHHGKGFGITKDTKLSLQPTGKTDPQGRTVYAVLTQDKDGGVQFVQNEVGKRLLYTFNPDTAPAVLREREKARVKGTAAIYNELIQQTIRNGTVDTGPNVPSWQKQDYAPERLYLPRDVSSEAEAKKHKRFRKDLWEMAVKQYDEGK